MQKSEISQLRKRLNSLCKQNNFSKQGTSYFRIVGDGVLQFIKICHERCFHHWELSIGLQSMYSKLEQQHFSSSGCIPQYYISNLKGQSSAVTMYADEDGVYHVQIDGLSEQINLLEKEGLRWLDTIDTQKKLVDAMCFLDKQSGGDVFVGDGQKIAPYLVSGDFLMADSVICAILRQHLFAQFGVWQEWTDDDYAKYERIYPGKEADWLKLHWWIATSDVKAIDRYLMDNYSSNMEFASFLHKSC